MTGMTGEQLIKTICAALDKVSEKNQGKTRSEWTEKIQLALYKAAPDKYYVCGHNLSSLDRGYGEWLYDIVWLEIEKLEKATADEPDWLIHRVPLIAECEWNSSNWAICEDFDKLLFGRADLRLMIYDGQDEGKTKQIAKLLCRRIEEFEDRKPGDGYLLAGYDGDRKLPGFDYFTITVGERCEVLMAAVSVN